MRVELEGCSHRAVDDTPSESVPRTTVKNIPLVKIDMRKYNMGHGYEKNSRQMGTGLWKRLEDQKLRDNVPDLRWGSKLKTLC